MKQHDWINNAGHVVFTAHDEFTRRAQPILKALHQFYGSDQSHMRVGDFSLIVYRGEVLAAKTYDDGGAAMRIPRDSEYWDEHVLDRTRQIGHIKTYLQPTHPHAAAIIAACTAELAQF